MFDLQRAMKMWRSGGTGDGEGGRVLMGAIPGILACWPV